jgi:hypothetical protein
MQDALGGALKIVVLPALERPHESRKRRQAET